MTNLPHTESGVRGRLIEGKAVAEQIHADTADRVLGLSRRGIRPRLIFIRVGEDAASRVYVGMKEKTAARLGISSDTVVLPVSTAESELLGLISKLNEDAGVHGILVQAPLPAHIRETRVYSSVNPAKDVDGFHPVNVGKLMLGDASGFVPCTPGGIHELLNRSGVSLPGAEVVVLGRGNIVGKPMAAILIQKDRSANATVTLCHSGTRGLEAHCLRADILIAAMGVPCFVRADMVKPGAVVVDVGVSRVPDANSATGSRLVGDVEFEQLLPVVSMITPNPGGVGPMTIAMLMRNTVRATELATA